MLNPLLLSVLSFNPRTRVGCDITGLSRPAFFGMFQSTHPRGVRLPSREAVRRLFPGFNPRTRVGCDMAPHAGHGLPALVSIHAPAWGATPCPDVPERAVRRFNPRTRVGCDPILRTAIRAMVSFNPRTRVGCDGNRKRAARSRPVSIHAPAWGATRTCSALYKFDLWFQSTHPRGVRRPSGPYPGCDRRFQSTHPRGVRRGHGSKAMPGCHVSIHAPAWGATCCLALASEGWKRTFQFTHPRGVRPAKPVPLLKELLEFQFTHPRGVRRRFQRTHTG